MTELSEESDFVEYLSGQAFSCAAAFHEFTLLYEDDDNAIHVFFEGEEDPSFYMPEIRRRAASRVLRSYICGGKWNVVSVRNEIISSGYEIDQCLFFIDRDFDDYLDRQPQPNDQTYVTDFYSIENHIVGTNLSDIILLDLVGMSRIDPDFIKLDVAIRKALENYTSLMRPFIAWCIASKEKDEKTNFANARLEKIFDVSHDGTVRLKGKAFQSFRKSVAAKDTAVTKDDMRRWKTIVCQDVSKLWLRGKYELWLFERVMLKALTEVVQRRRASKQRAPRIPSAVRDRCLFDLAGGRLQPPDSLVNFLNRQLN